MQLSQPKQLCTGGRPRCPHTAEPGVALLGCRAESHLAPNAPALPIYHNAGRHNACACVMRVLPQRHLSSVNGPNSRRATSERALSARLRAERGNAATTGRGRSGGRARREHLGGSLFLPAPAASVLTHGGQRLQVLQLVGGGLGRRGRAGASGAGGRGGGLRSGQSRRRRRLAAALRPHFGLGGAEGVHGAAQRMEGGGAEADERERRGRKVSVFSRRRGGCAPKLEPAPAASASEGTRSPSASRAAAHARHPQQEQPRRQTMARESPGGPSLATPCCAAPCRAAPRDTPGRGAGSARRRCGTGPQRVAGRGQARSRRSAGARSSALAAGAAPGRRRPAGCRGTPALCARSLPIRVALLPPREVPGAPSELLSSLIPPRSLKKFESCGSARCGWQGGFLAHLPSSCRLREGFARPERARDPQALPTQACQKATRD